jgi:hypothetical protein
MSEHRRYERRKFDYYMYARDENTQQVLGHMADISSRGFKLDCTQPQQIGREFRLRIDLPPDVSDKSSMTFLARVRWCRTDHLDPFVFNVGFEIVNISPSDAMIYQRIYERYGTGSLKQ